MQATAALLGITALLDAWDLLHMARWLPKSWTIVEVAMFRFHVSIVGAIVGCSIAGILPLYLALRANQKEAATPEKHTE